MKPIVLMGVLIILVLSACGTSDTATVTAPTPVALPLVSVDLDHMINPTNAYAIPAGEGFILNAAGFDFGIANGPTAIQLSMDGHVYSGVWTKGAVTQEVLASSLLPPAGFMALTGFPAGKKLIVTIGWTSADNRFNGLWSATIIVQ
jgi:hypothetical protein